MKRTQIYLKEKQLLQIKEIAQEKDVSVAETIREIIDASFILNDAPLERKPRRKASEEFAEMKKKLTFSGPEDLSENHDKYAYDI